MKVMESVIVRRSQELLQNDVFSRTNRVFIGGIIERDLVRSNDNGQKESFYKTRVRVIRPSGTEDLIPIIISGVILKEKREELTKGKYVEVAGTLISHNCSYEDSCKTIALFAKSIDTYQNEKEMQESVSTNAVYLEGYIEEQPFISITPTGKLIANFAIMTERGDGEWFYLNCITWNKAATYVSCLEVGDLLQMHGRLLSWHNPITSYESKRNSDYEVSIIRIHKK